MKEKIKNAILEFQKSSDVESRIEFLYESSKAHKQVKALIHNGSDNKPSISLLSSEGYNLKYIQSKLKSNFNKMLTDTLPHVKINDKVLTKQDPNLTILKGTSRYYCVNGSIINCDGREFVFDYEAAYIGENSARCGASTETITYTEYKLTKKL